MRDHFPQCRHFHPKFGVTRHAPHVFLAQPERNRCFFHGAVRLIRCVNAKSRDIGATRQSELARGGRGLLARDRERVHDSYRGRVVNDAVKFLRQMQPLAEPIDHERFQLGRGR